MHRNGAGSVVAKHESDGATAVGVPARVIRRKSKKPAAACMSNPWSMMRLRISLGFYVLWLVGGLSDQWKQLKDVSIFTASTPQKALETGSLDPLSVGILSAITAACVVAALGHLR